MNRLSPGRRNFLTKMIALVAAGTPSVAASDSGSAYAANAADGTSMKAACNPAAMRSRDARYNAIPRPEAPNIDATVAYVATRSPIHLQARLRRQGGCRETPTTNPRPFCSHASALRARRMLLRPARATATGPECVFFTRH